MKWNEFNRSIDDLGFKREELNGCIVIMKEIKWHGGEATGIVAKISKTRQFEFEMCGYRELMDMDPELKEKLFDVLIEYAKTPLEYRMT